MRLLECSHDGFKLTTFRDAPRLCYTVAHVGPDNEEVTFRDIADGMGTDKLGYEKIRFCAAQAKRDGSPLFLGRHALHRQVEQHRAGYGNQFHVSLVSKCDSMLAYTGRMSKRMADLSLNGRRHFQGRASGSLEDGRLQELLSAGISRILHEEGPPAASAIRSLFERQIHEITGIAVAALREATSRLVRLSKNASGGPRHGRPHEEDWAYCPLGIFGGFHATYIRRREGTRGSSSEK